MTTHQNEEGQKMSSPPAGFGERVVERYQKIKEHAETYPYVWASYIVVYGGFGLWFTYRWRKLRKTEDRVRVLIEKLRKRREEEERASSATPVGKTPPSTTSVEKGSSSIDRTPK